MKPKHVFKLWLQLVTSIFPQIISKFGSKISISRLQAEFFSGSNFVIEAGYFHRMQKIQNRYLTRKDFRNSYPIYIK